MVGRNFTIDFTFTDKEYKEYDKWCGETGQKGTYTGTIGGSQTFHCCPTSLGEIIWVSTTQVVYDELGNISYDEQGNPREKTIEHIIRNNL